MTDTAASTVEGTRRDPADQQFSALRCKFAIPTLASLGISQDDAVATYLCGNSLGLMPLQVKPAILRELDAWLARGVESHFNHPYKANGATDWVDIDLPLVPLLAPLVGALESEVAIMGSLTQNLNALLVSFYKPRGNRTKILIEKNAFPSDHYAFLNMLKLHGYDESHLLEMGCSEGKTFIDTQDITLFLTEHRQEIALVCFPGVQYYTGQLFDIDLISSHAKVVSNNEIVVGWDLAHAIGNVPLDLHRCNVDFATWCSYKYLNAGPGAILGIFVHERHTQSLSLSNYSPRLAGWWGNNSKTRFQMLTQFDPIPLALSYRQLNPSVLDVVLLHESLKLFQEAGGIHALRERSIRLTQFLQDRLQQSPYISTTPSDKLAFQILTPLDQKARGCQLLLKFYPDEQVMETVFSALHQKGIIVDERRPSVIRIAPTPLYNTFEEVDYAVKCLDAALDEIAGESH